MQSLVNQLELASVRTYALAIPIFLAAWYYVYRWRPLSSIPTVGGPGYPLASYVASYQFLRHGSSVLQEGYSRYKGGMFKIGFPNRWVVILTGPRLMEELARLPNDVMSNTQAHVTLLEAKYTMGPAVAIDPHWLTDLVLSFLTKNLAPLFPEVHDEIHAAFNDYVPLSDDWVAVPAMDTIRKIICRSSSRVFVGLPKCRDPDWIELNAVRAGDIKRMIPIIGMLPNFLKPFVTKYLTPFPKHLARGLRHLEPIIRERKNTLDALGKDDPNLPVDLLTWMLTHSGGNVDRSSMEALTQQMLLVNFAAIQTSSVAFGHALFTLAANPSYVISLREEVESVIQAHGWSKVSVARMYKLDSFLKEIMRCNFAGLKLLRLAVKTHTFSDGTTIPAGTAVAAPGFATHTDDELYESAKEFMPFRFSEKRCAENERTKHQFSATSLDYIAFGHGRAACPGRFFASTELKSMLAHVILNYDIKTEVDGVRPKNLEIGPELLPNPTAPVLFRKRQLWNEV